MGLFLVLSFLQCSQKCINQLGLSSKDSFLKQLESIFRFRIDISVVQTSTECSIGERLAFHLEQGLAFGLLVVVESWLVMELVAFSVSSFLAFVGGSVGMDLGFAASGCFNSWDFGFYNFGYMVFFLRVFSFVCQLGSFRHESIHLSK